MPGTFSKRIQDISPADIAELCQLEFPEGEQVEYKQFIPGRDGPDSWHSGTGKIGDYGRNAFLAEVVAFANTRGGHVLIGIEESSDKPRRAVRTCPVPSCHDAADRLRQQAFALIEPPLGDLQFHTVPIDESGAGVIVIRVGQSRNGPHRLKAKEWHCYTRRGDSSEVLTMREIQDLTLNVARGVEGIDRRLAEARGAFEARVRPEAMVTESRRSAIRCTLIPTSPLLLTRPQLHEALSASRREFITTRKSGGRDAAQFPISGYSQRPVLRGLTIYHQSPGVNYIQSVFVDGAQTCEFDTQIPIVDKEAGGIFLQWILGAAACALHMGETVSNLCESPSVEYCVELQVCVQGGAARLLLDERWRSDRHSFGKPNLILPRYSYVAEAGMCDALATISADCMNAAGLDELDPIVAVN